MNQGKGGRGASNRIVAVDWEGSATPISAVDQDDLMRST